MDKDTTAPQRRAQIVRGAFDALQENGLPALSYDLVARHAGISRQLVRYHFPSHEELMLEVCDYLAGLYRDALVSTAGALSGAERVNAFMDFYFDLIDGMPKPRDDRVYDAMMAMAAHNRPIREALRGQYRLLGQVLSHEFEAQHADITRAASEELSYLFVCLMYGHWKMVASLGLSPAHRHVTRAAMDRLIRSYAQTAPPEGERRLIWQ